MGSVLDGLTPMKYVWFTAVGDKWPIGSPVGVLPVGCNSSELFDCAAVCEECVETRHSSLLLLRAEEMFWRQTTGVFP